MQYYDFLRSQVQLNPSENLLLKDNVVVDSPMKYTKIFINQMIDKWLPEMRKDMTMAEKVKYLVTAREAVEITKTTQTQKQTQTRVIQQNKITLTCISLFDGG